LLLLGLAGSAYLAMLAAWRHDGLLLAAAVVAGGPIAWLLIARAQRARQDRQYVRILFDDSPIPAAITRPADGTFVDANAAFLMMVGHPREQVIGRTSVEVGLWSSPRRRAEGLKDLVEHGTLREREAPFRKSSGELGHALFSVQMIEIDREQHVLLLMQDITPRKRAEEAVRAKEALLSALVNNTDDLVLAVDRNLRVTMMNEALRAAIERNYGFTLTLGDDVYRMVVPERRTELEAVFSRALQGESQRVERSFLLPNGRQVSQDEAYNPIFDAGGRVTGISIFIHDVSAQRRAAQTIQSIINGTAAALGEAFFRSLVCELAAALGTRYALVGELLTGEVAQIRTVAVAVGGAIAENFDYVLTGTPCEGVIKEGTQFYPDGLCAAFPVNSMLREMGVQSYLGVVLRGASGQPLGLLAVLNDRSMRDSMFARTLLGVFAARAGAELDRLQSESEKRRALAILEEATDLVAWSDSAGHIRYMNAALRRVRGLSRDAPLDGLRIGEFHTPWARRLIHDVGIPIAVSRGMWVGETEVIGTDGVLKPMSQLIMAHRDSAGVEYLSTIMRDLSEQKRAEAALREREAGLRMAQQVGKVGSWERDLCSNRLTWSEETYRIVGADPNSFIPTRESLFERVHPEDLPRLTRASEDAQAGLSPFAIDYRVMLPDGSARHVHARADVMFDERGRARRMVGTIQDITERKRAEDELKASEQRFRRLVETTQVVPWTSDPEQQRFTYIGPQIEKIAGYPAQAWCAAGFWRSKLEADQRDAIIELCHAGLARGEDHELEYRFLAADGRWLWLRELVGVVTGPDGRRTLQGFLLDVTQSRSAEAELRLAAQVFQSSGEAIVITDAQHCILTVNPAFSHITGYAPLDAMGKTPYALSSSMRSAERERDLWAEVDRDGYWQGEVWDRRRSGEVFPKWLTISAVRDGQGRSVNYIEIFSDITERKEREERVRHLAHHDALTDLPNRALLNDRIAQAVSLAERNRTRVAVMFLDLDRFKTVNDSLGHSVGDKLLREVSSRLKSCMRASDTVSRLGGDEFVILMPNVTDSEDVAVTAGKVLDAVARPYNIDGHELVSTPSVGISVYPADGADVDTLLRNADAAMYHAKETGRNNYQFFTQDMNARALERLSLDRSLRRALERDELRLHYQPQYGIADGRIVGLEALIRWQHPEQGLVPPLVFIKFAEESGLILQIGDWVLREACRQNRAWQDAGLPPLPVSVNISALQFHQPDFVHSVARALAGSGLEARYLQLEVTESIIMHDAERVTESLERLKDMGLELAIDDFGTGYSSLSYLKRFPIDRLKIDRSFVQDVTADTDDEAIIGAIIALTRKLGLRTIAEGVETREQLKFLRDQGCDEVQGFLLSRPLAPPDCAASLAREGGSHRRQVA
jgi:diguanylate cyclase (GGDEF)-like protein/PAS domain S-box-containing protein